MEEQPHRLYKIITKTKPSHVTFELTWRSIVRFTPQKMQWYH